MKKKYNISVDGCDDSTKFEVELAENEFNLVETIVKKNNKVATEHCQPTIRIEESNEDK